MPDFVPGNPRQRIPFVMLAFLILALCYSRAKAQSFNVSPGEDVHTIVRNAGENATIRFAPGLYRLSKRIDPLNGQRFIGGEGVILSGARVLTGWKPDGQRWYIDGQTQQGIRKTVSGETMCEKDAPRCNYPELLFRDGQPLKHGSVLGDGEWFFDYDRDRIYVYSDPTGRLMETSIINTGATNCAICGGANNVTVRDFTFTQFGTTLENAAVEGFNPGGRGWVIEGNTFIHNGAIGAVVRANGVIRNNVLSYNGQAGYGAGNGAGIVIENNEIAWNNWRGVNPFFSSGGGKSSFTVGLIFRGNYVHNNYKRGVWFDLDNSNTLIERNRIERNDTGLFMEMGGSATIRDNAFTCNGSGSDNTFQTSILVTNASDILIEDNDITVCAEGNAIGVREDGNPTRLIDGTRRETDNVVVQRNRITFLACAGAVGQDGYGGGVLGTVIWQHNAYTLKCADHPHWLVEGVKWRWPQWVARWPLDTLATVGPIPKPTASPTMTATATIEPTQSATPEATKTPAVYWRFKIEVIIRGWCLATCD